MGLVAIVASVIANLVAFFILNAILDLPSAADFPSLSPLPIALLTTVFTFIGVVVFASVLTFGMIDPSDLRWGEQLFAFAKRRLLRPVVDLDALRVQNRRLGEWVDARRRPKLVLATQTRVLELWVDERGTTVPATPVLSTDISP